MSNREARGATGGFGAVKSPFGFAAAMRGAGGRSYGSYAAEGQPGFSAALRKSERRQAKAARARLRRQIFDSSAAEQEAAGVRSDDNFEPPRPRPKSRPVVVIDSEVLSDDKGLERLTTAGIVIGRRVNVQSGGWKKFEGDLQSLSEAYQTIPYNRLTMPYLSDAETDGLVSQMLGKRRRRPDGPADEIAAVRSFREQLCQQVAGLVRLDFENEMLTCEAYPDEAVALEERLQHPDWYAQSKKDADETANVERPSDNYGLFNQAGFFYQGLGSIGLHTKTIELEDSTGVLAAGRKKIVDMIGDRFSLDTSHIAEKWSGPQIPIWQMVGRYSLAGFQYQMPKMPFYEITLNAAGVFERPELKNNARVPY